MDCQANPIPDLLIMGAATLAIFFWKKPSRTQSLYGDQLKRRYPRLRWVPAACWFIMLAWFVLFISFLFVMNRPYHHPGVVFGGGVAFWGVMEGLMGVLTGVYPLDTRWSRWYIIGMEAQRRGLKQMLASLAVLLVATAAGIWLE